MVLPEAAFAGSDDTAPAPYEGSVADRPGWLGPTMPRWGRRDALLLSRWHIDALGSARLPGPLTAALGADTAASAAARWHQQPPGAVISRDVLDDLAQHAARVQPPPELVVCAKGLGPAPAAPLLLPQEILDALQDTQDEAVTVAHLVAAGTDPAAMVEAMAVLEAVSKDGAVLALMGDPQRNAAAADLVRALRRVRRGATDTQRAVYDAVLDRDPAPTIAAAAAARGVSPQAIGTMVKRLHARIDDIAAEPLDWLAGLVASAIGHIAAPGAAVAAAAGCLPGSGRHRRFARRLLVARLGYVRYPNGVFEVSPAAAAAVDECAAIAASGGDASAVFAAARHGGWEHSTEAVAAAAGVEIRCGMLWRHGSRPAQIADAFERVGSPATAAQIAAAAGVSEQVARNTLSSDRRFVRAGFQTWALSGTVEAEYKSIAQEIRRHIDTRGGSAPEAEIIAAVSTNSAVSEVSVRSIMAAPAFSRENGHVSLSLPRQQPPAAGGARCRFRCDETHLRGYSVQVTAAFAAALGVAAGGRAFVPVSHPPNTADASLIWNADSHTGPMLGRIREALHTIGAHPGDTVTAVAEAGTLRLEPPVPGPSPDTARLGVRARRSPPARVCQYEHCAKQFTPRTDTARYCTKDCRSAANAETLRARYQTRQGNNKIYAAAQRRCETCGENFTPKTSQNTCSPKCRAEHRKTLRRRGPIRRCAACAAYYREREGQKGCCSPECYEAAAAGMNWELLGRGCSLAVLVLLAEETRGGGHATSESIAARLNVSRSNALKHLGALQRAGLAVRFTPVSDRAGGAPHEFKATIPAALVAKVAPGADSSAVESLVASRTTPPQLGTDLWVLATLNRLLPDSAGIVRRADVAAAIGRHTSSVSRSLDRLQSAGLAAHRPIPSVTAAGNGTGGGIHITITANSAPSATELAAPLSESSSPVRRIAANG